MKLTYNWLKEYVRTDLPPAEVAEALTMRGLEVDAVTPLYPHLTSIKVARVLTVEPHPNADKLRVCNVRHDDGEPVQVVCGAPNVRPEMIVALALPGATMPSGMVIRKAKIRGVSSGGMLCSQTELGLGDDASGIMDLPADLPVGSNLAQALGLDDTFIEVDLTPNRADCASVIGIAREVASVAGKKLIEPISEPPKLAGNVPFAVDILAPDGCPRYAARLVTNVTIGPSPAWLRYRLRAVGIRPINNVVDVTNFVMMEYGQPLHAFDFATIAGSRIVVRKAMANETITTLDGVRRDLDPEMLLICDAERPVAIAGIMGGENSEVTGSTTQVLIESAYFDPVSIRRTGRRLNLASEASYRFERGVDPNGTVKALERAARLIAEVTGGVIVEGGVDNFPGAMSLPPLQLRVSRANKLLGTGLTASEILKLLVSIELGVEKLDDNTLLVTAPSFRIDLLREIDLIEEVARLIGYEAIPVDLPYVPMSFPAKEPIQQLCESSAQFMAGNGFYEAINYSFVTERFFDMLRLRADDGRREVVRLVNPLSDDQSVMRTTLVPGLIENLRRNINRQNVYVRLFEIGKVFHPRAGQQQPRENMRLTGILSGPRHPSSLTVHLGGGESVDFYDAKGAVEVLLRHLDLAGVEFTAGAEDIPYGRSDRMVSITCGDQQLGIVAGLTSEVLKEFGIKQEAFLFDLDLDAVLFAPRRARRFAPLPKYPAVNRDMAVIVASDVPAGEMVKAIHASKEPLVEKVEIFDVYQGKPIDAGQKSVAISITYRSSEQTLDEAAVSEVHNRLANLIISRFHGRLREAIG